MKQKNVVVHLLVIVDVNLSESPLRSFVLLEVTDFSVDFSKKLKKVVDCSNLHFFIGK